MVRAQERNQMDVEPSLPCDIVDNFDEDVEATMFCLLYSPQRNTQYSIELRISNKPGNCHINDSVFILGRVLRTFVVYWHKTVYPEHRVL